MFSIEDTENISAHLITKRVNEFMNDQQVDHEPLSQESGSNKPNRRTKRTPKNTGDTLIKQLKSKRTLSNSLRSLNKGARDSLLSSFKSICEEIDLEEDIKREEEAKQKALVETMTAQLESQGLSKNAIISILTNK
ncbi:hypothetical protein [Vibrio agarivorans]|uniref:Uncharacterized protein n=1 Tax=Vibrio agarivorans TaxID=153622 RepID=A0ABT7Y751_9VIBR|nr:hypothetical protein [Vibrio agarivorans]MDN2483825.1 hypothetical protein [Vibrio agarivorans]